jgi:hypothetical protein
VDDLFSRLAGIGPSTQRALKAWVDDPNWDLITENLGAGDALDVGYDYGFIFGIANVMGLTVVELLEQTRYLK